MSGDFLDEDGLDPDFSIPTGSFDLVSDYSHVIAAVERAITQLSVILRPSASSEHRVLASLSQDCSEPRKIVSLITFMVQRIGSYSSDFAKLFGQVQEARAELKFSENRVSRLLLHLQQNVRLLTRIATDHGETTIVQEAAQNVASISSLEHDVPRDHMKRLRLALVGGGDQTAGLEVMELLKEEISVNAVLRKQIETLFGDSRRLSKAVADLRESASSARVDAECVVSSSADLLHCNNDDVIPSLTRLIAENRELRSEGARRDASLKRYEMIEREIRKKLGPCEGDDESGLEELVSAAIDRVEHARKSLAVYEDKQAEVRRTRLKLGGVLGVAGRPNSELDALLTVSSEAIKRLEENKLEREETERAVRTARLRLGEALNIRCQADSELDALLFIAAKATENVADNQRAARALGVPVGRVCDAVTALKEENSRLINRQVAESEHDATLLDIDIDSESPDSPPHDEVSTLLSLSDDRIDGGSDTQTTQINELQTQFGEIERELEELQRQIYGRGS